MASGVAALGGFPSAIFLLFFLGGSATEKSTSPCDHAAVNVCLGSFKATALKDEQMKFGKEERKIICRSLDDFKTCFGGTGCQELAVVQPMFAGFSDAEAFICNETRHQNDEADKCWASGMYDTAQTFCQKKLGGQVPPPTEICDENNKKLSCVVRSVNKCCGSEAANYASTFLLKLMTPISVTMECTPNTQVKDVPEIDNCPARQGGGGGVSVGGLVAIIFFVIILVAVVVAVGVFLYVRRKRRAETVEWSSI